MKEKFGEYIHNLRVEHGLTLTKLAAALDIDQSTLSKIENQKRNVPEEILPKLAKAFKLDIKKLEKEFYSEKIAESKKLPLPQALSKITSPGLVKVFIRYLPNSIGFCVGCKTGPSDSAVFTYIKSSICCSS